MTKEVLSNYEPLIAHLSTILENTYKVLEQPSLAIHKAYIEFKSQNPNLEHRGYNLDTMIESLASDLDEKYSMIESPSLAINKWYIRFKANLNCDKSNAIVITNTENEVRDLNHLFRGEYMNKAFNGSEIQNYNKRWYWIIKDGTLSGSSGLLSFENTLSRAEGFPIYDFPAYVKHNFND